MVSKAIREGSAGSAPSVDTLQQSRTTSNNKESTPQLLSRAQAVEFLIAMGFPCSYDRLSRYRETGPRFFRVGRFVRYQTEDLIKWAKSHMVTPAGGE